MVDDCWLILCQVVYFGYYMAWPMLASHHGWPALALLWLTAEVIAGWMLAFLFQVRQLS